MCTPRNCKIITCVRGVVFAFIFLLRPLPSLGSTQLDNNLSINIDTVWQDETFLANKVTVESDVTLSIEQGVVVKFEEAGELNIYGTLRIEGQTGSEVRMEPNDENLAGWQGIKFLPGSTSYQSDGSGSLVEHAEITFASKGIECGSASPKINSCLISDSTYYGIYLYNSSAEISLNTFVNNEVNLFCDADSSPTISLNIFGSSVYLAEVAPNIVEDVVKGGVEFSVVEESSAETVIKVLGGSITKKPNWPTFLPGTANTYKFTYYISDDLYIAADASLRFSAGGSIELAAGKDITVEGSLSAIGTETNNIVFNAREMEPVMNWGRVHFLQTSRNSELVFCTLMYGGSQEAAVVVESSATTITNSHIEHSENVGLYIDSTDADLNIEDNTISNCDSFPLAARESKLNNLLSNNTFQDNNFNNSVVILPSVIENPTIWDKIGYTRVLLGISSVSANTTLEIKPGVIVKFLADGGLFVNGKLEADGSNEQIVFTSAKDAEHGHKSALESEIPSLGDWLGISFNSAEGSILENSIVKYGDGIWVGNSDVTISQCTISYNENSGIMCTPESIPIINDNDIAYNNGYNIGVPIHLHERVITENRFTDNAVNALYISGGTTSGDVTWRRDTYNGERFFYVVGGDINIGGKLSIEKNVLLKLENSSITCTGEVAIIGEDDFPITLTSTKSTPSANDWGGIVMLNGNSTNIIKHCNIEYGNVALSCSNGQVTLENVSFLNNNTAVEAINGTRAVLAGVNICTNGLGLYLRDSSGFVFNSLFRNNVDSGAVYAYNSQINMRNTIVSKNTFGVKVDLPTQEEFISYCDIYDNDNGNFIIDNSNVDITQYGDGNISEDPRFESDACDTLWDNASPCYGAGELETIIGYKMPILDVSVSSEFSAYDYGEDVVLTIEIGRNPIGKYVSYVISPDNSVLVVEMSQNNTVMTGTFHIDNSYHEGDYTILGLATEGQEVGVDTTELYIGSDWEGIPPKASFAINEISLGTFSFDASASLNANGTDIDLAYSWNLGDGTYRDGKIVLYKYRDEGEYEVELTLTDRFGEMSISKQNLNVTAVSLDYPPRIEEIERTDPERIDDRLVSLVRVVISDENEDVESVTIDLTEWGVPSVLMRDDGTLGDVVESDGIYYAFIEIPSDIEPGEYSIPITVVDAAELSDIRYIEYLIDSDLLGRTPGGEEDVNTEISESAPLLSPFGNIMLSAVLIILACLKVGETNQHDFK